MLAISSHHATPSIAAYGFLIIEQGTFSLSGVNETISKLKKLAVPKNYQPRGSSFAHPTSRSSLHRDNADAHRYRSRQISR